ncbi:MAG: hypothetical protein A2298_05340 [Gammaproteobacteria bacterium RIFOXYB2_FULL_38_6]|nr:MAG: hypothetical protein A2298_05340 [Gammaproteobacteria bacterium RIFOXYB2_FULL_38_6]
MRTYQMHSEAELGIAAHWVYKEGGDAASTYESKINYLRQVIDWQKQMDEDHPDISIQEIFNDRVYVFTPNGDVIDLPKGATPLDCAYHIHTQIGHRCRGAKINHVLVPLTTQLKTGDQVSILLSKTGAPSRDWLNPESGYLVSPRARAKVQHYFKHQDDAQHLELGTDIWHKFCRRKHLDKSLIEEAIDAFAYKTKEQLLMGLGAHDVHIDTVYAALRQKNLVKKESESAETELPAAETKSSPVSSSVAIEGMDELLTQTAGCCKPIPGDQIIGYITRSRGITIHKQACSNIKHIADIHPERLITVNWHAHDTKYYPVDLIIDSQDYAGLLRDITQTIAAEEISILQMTTHTSPVKNSARVLLTLSINNQAMLTSIIQKFQHLPKIISVARK